MPSDYAILAFNAGPGRNLPGDNPIAGVPELKVYARVRMWVGDKEIDENFEVPENINGLPQTDEIRTAFVTPLIIERLKELEKGKFGKSSVHPKEHNLAQDINARPEAAL